MTKCEAYWNKVAQFVKNDDFEGFCTWCEKNRRYLKDDWEICKLRLNINNDGAEISATSADVFRPLIRERNKPVRDSVIQTIKKRLKSKNPETSKLTGTIVRRLVKQAWKDLRGKHIKYQHVEVQDFLVDQPYLKSLVSYKNRGSFGDAYFAGNASGFLLIELAHFFKAEVVFDPMEGGGTSRDVCNAMNLKYVGNDLLSGGYDVVEASEEKIPINDLTYFHPPYWNLIKYSDHPNDLSNAKTWDEFLDKLAICVNKLLRKTKVLALLIGDVLKDKGYYCALEILYPFRQRIFRVLIKERFTVLGIKGFYDAMEENRIPLRHEYVVLLKGDLFNG